MPKIKAGGHAMNLHNSLARIRREMSSIFAACNISARSPFKHGFQVFKIVLFRRRTLQTFMDGLVRHRGMLFEIADLINWNHWTNLNDTRVETYLYSTPT